MNRRDLDAIREREAAATAGPWTYEGRVLWGRDEYGRVKADIPADRAFTEHAREDVPALLAEVDRLRADLRIQYAEFLVVRTERDAAQTSVDELRTELTRVRAQRDEARDEVDALRSIVDDLYDPNPCRFDHHGYCQEHGWLETDPPCPDGRAQKLLGGTP